MNSNVFEVNETTETASTVSFDIHLIFSNNGQICTRLYNKEDNCNFTIINFGHFDSNIHATLLHGVYISQLSRHARACTLYSNILQRHRVSGSTLLC